MSSLDAFVQLQPYDPRVFSTTSISPSPCLASQLPNEVKALLGKPKLEFDESVNEKDDPPFEITNIEGKGEGLVATRDLVPGDFIISGKVELTAGILTPSVDELDRMLSQLSTEDRGAFNRLHNCYTDEEPGGSAYIPPDIIGKWETNAFAIDGGCQMVFLGAITKLNHACRENVAKYYCSKTNTSTIVACDYIKTGQELVFSYADPLQDCHSRRLSTINSWNFLCLCDVCTQEPEALAISDERRMRLSRVARIELKKRLHPERRMQLLKEALDLCRAEGLYSLQHLFSVACVELCADLDLEEQVSAWAAIAAEHLIADRGIKHEEVLFMQRCVRNPRIVIQIVRERESWLKRLGRFIAVIPEIIC